ncbi:hypothetical protein A3747_14880 [Sulfitobacter sp. HI0076]|nr:hypothetical protein A3722_08945 [Sulfitobacter sp. HI0027]KZZ02612.1 hypothetical protein A3747_14880 [Sulfitobacter sp. HI0076]
MYVPLQKAFEHTIQACPKVKPCKQTTCNNGNLFQFWSPPKTNPASPIAKIGLADPNARISWR